jgi:hypothetical protein
MKALVIKHPVHVNVSFDDGQLPVAAI